MAKIITLLVAVMLSITGCNENNIAEDRAETAAENREEKSIIDGDDNMININIKINGVDFEAELYNNETVNKFAESLPVTYNMSDLHGNEKYYYMDNGLPVKSERPSTINEGDIMLFGSDCLVVFYDTFKNSYSYTRLGYIKDTKGLREALGNGNVMVTFDR